MPAVTDPQQDLQEWTALVQGVRKHSFQAEGAFVSLVGRWLLPFLRRNLPRALQGKCDPLDIVQDVLARALACGHLTRLPSSPARCRALLVKMAHDRLIDLMRHYRRELAHLGGQEGEADRLAAVPARQVQPDADEYEGQPQAARCRRRQDIVRLLGEGHGKAEVSARLRLSARTFRRDLVWLRGHVRPAEFRR